MCLVSSLAFVGGIHWWLVDSPRKGPVTLKIFPFDDVIVYLWTSAFWLCDDDWLVYIIPCPKCTVSRYICCLFSNLVSAPLFPGTCPSAIFQIEVLFWFIEAELRIYASVNYAISGSDNGLSPVRCQAIIWTKVTYCQLDPKEQTSVKC